MPVRTIAPPASCAAESVSSSQTQATMEASTTSTMATIETRVAMGERVLANLEAHFAGQPLPNEVRVPGA